MSTATGQGTRATSEAGEALSKGEVCKLASALIGIDPAARACRTTAERKRNPSRSAKEPSAGKVKGLVHSPGPSPGGQTVGDCRRVAGRRRARPKPAFSLAVGGPALVVGSAVRVVGVIIIIIDPAGAVQTNRETYAAAADRQRVAVRVFTVLALSAHFRLR